MQPSLKLPRCSFPVNSERERHDWKSARCQRMSVRSLSLKVPLHAPGPQVGDEQGLRQAKGYCLRGVWQRGRCQQGSRGLRTWQVSTGVLSEGFGKAESLPGRVCQGGASERTSNRGIGGWRVCWTTTPSKSALGEQTQAPNLTECPIDECCMCGRWAGHRGDLA